MTSTVPQGKAGHSISSQTSSTLIGVPAKHGGLSFFLEEQHGLQQGIKYKNESRASSRTCIKQALKHLLQHDESSSASNILNN